MFECAWRLLASESDDVLETIIWRFCRIDRYLVGQYPTLDVHALLRRWSMVGHHEAEIVLPAPEPLELGAKGESHT